MAVRKLTARIHSLSVREILALKVGDHSDGGGLILRVLEDRANWVFRYTSPSGRRREMGLGPCQRQNSKMVGESLQNARENARKAREMLTTFPPVDPIDERDRARKEAAAAEQEAKSSRQARSETLGRVVRTYHERFVEPKLSTAQSARWIGALEKHVPPRLWNKPITEVTRTELLDFFLDIQSRMADTAQRIRRRLDEIYDDATDRGIVTDNIVASLRDKLRRRHVSHPVTPRPSLPFPETPAFVKALRDEPGIAARCLEFVILTAARTGEAIGATWTEIDLDGALWTIPRERMKGGEVHVVHLVPRALEILAQMQEIGSTWVFPTPKDPTLHLSNMAMLTLLKRMERRDITVHGFRATFSTWANETGIGRPDVIEACLAHRENDRIRAAYNRAKFVTDRRQLLLDWAAFVGGSNVIEMQGSRAA
jgi:integrase